MDGRGSYLFLLCRVRALVCAFPLAQVSEVMRRLPADPLPGMPAYVRGLSVIRGLPTPVVDAAELLESGAGGGDRYVLLHEGERKVALLVDEVLGVRALGEAMLGDLPPLFRSPEAGFIAALGRLDDGLFMLLRMARLLPEALWAEVNAVTGRA
ncbi:MAG TPA: chemotaxis protein CheW [Burkholderiales bacterium]|jgi:purine-binding chemotaxis protein CheW